MSADKHVNYFALQKACEKDGCPLCTIINERIDRYIDGMLFEHISDRTFRAQYREAGGFCPSHAEALLSYRDGLAVAILGRGTLQDYLVDFEKRKMRKYKMPCPACAERERIEKEFLTFIAETKDAPRAEKNKKSAPSADTDSSKSDAAAFIDFFTHSSGLCVPHYAALIRYAKKVPKWLSTFQEEKFSRLEERTARFIDFSAWGKQKDFATLSDEDKVVWKELASALRGTVK